jgi:N-acetylmuramoyl-L-alanine amidase
MQRPRVPGIFLLVLIALGLLSSVFWLQPASLNLLGFTSSTPIAPPATVTAIDRPSVGAAPSLAMQDEPAILVATATALPPTPQASPMALVASPTATASAAASGPTARPTPSPRPAELPWRVGLQVGHWKSNELPEELARLRSSTGARYGNITEAEVNYAIAMHTLALLEAEGIVVDILPATVPPGYDADAFIAIHADGHRNSRARGWKLATPWRTSDAGAQLADAVATAYGPATGLPQDVNGITYNMRGYYAFSYRRYDHAIARTTPAIIVETGFMSNAADREIILGAPELSARGIANGVLAYLAQRDRNDGAALLPPEFPRMRALPGGAQLRSAPEKNARILLQITPDDRVIVFRSQNGWYEAVVRGKWRNVGWVRVDQLEGVEENSDEPATLPTATNP